MVTSIKANPMQFVAQLMTFGRGGAASTVTDLVSANAWRRERNQMAKMYTDLIANADDHILNDLGVSREALFRMREDLFR